MSLDTGVLKAIFAEEKYWSGTVPVTVQILSVRAIPNETGKRLRLLISDGVYSINTVVRPECVDYLEENGVQKTTIITLQNYEIERMGASNKHVLIIGELVLKQVESEKIGSNLLSVDEYFREHPEEDRFQGSDTDRTPTPQTTTTTTAPQAAAPVSAPAPVKQRQSPPPQQQKQQNDNRRIVPIEQISPYDGNRTIKGRISFKSDMRTWSNQRGEGKLFNVNFLDETGEIRATAFKDNADKFFSLLQEGKVYYVSKARVQPARGQFSNLDHTYELQLDRDTIIEECLDASDVPKLNYNFTKLNKIQALEANTIIDVVGVIKEVLPHFQINSKAGRSYDRRDITIVDDSQFAITVGLWNKMALNFEIPEGTVVAIKGAKVSDFNGKTLSLTPSATILPNPDAPEAYTIKGWYDAQGRNESFQTLKTEMTSRKTSIDDRKTIAEIQALESSFGEKPEYFSIKATVSFIKTENFSYPACLTEGCNRKVIEQNDGTWRCEKCDINHAVPNHRYILTISVLDQSGQLWLTLFEDQAKILLDVSANDLNKFKEEGDPQFQQTFTKVQMNEYDFRLRARLDNYNQQTRVRYNALNVNKIDYANESDYLVGKFEKLLN